MAIQLPDVGTGVPADQTGDSPWLAMKKVRENFNDQTNAASREIGISNNQIPTAAQVFEAAYSKLSNMTSSNDSADTYASGTRFFVYGNQDDKNLPTATSKYWIVETSLMHFSAPLSSTRRQVAYGHAHEGSLDVYFRVFGRVGWSVWTKFYTAANTQLDSNGALKPSSPVLRVFNDRITGNDDGDAMAAEYIKNGVGDYTITGTTGLRTDGWYVVIPNDMNGNPKVAITLDDTDGVITLKTYVRIFDMTTFKFVPDLEQPLDIPDGRWIDLRFNDLPIEVQEELPTDGG